MAFTTVTHNHLEYYHADSIAAPHGFTTRLGGVSEGPLASLNLGTGRGDAPENVRENWARVAAALGFDLGRLVFPRQVHGAGVRVVTEAGHGRGLSLPPWACDGLITDRPGTALAVFTADCVPILLHDPVTGAVGAVHAGWRGTALGIAAAAVEAMAGHFGAEPETIRAAVGPCIDRCCFETDRDVPDAMLAALGEEARAAIDDLGNGKFRVDLKDLNGLWLRRAGVRRIQTSRRCTACDPARFWSHRRVGDQRGSLAAVIVCP